MCGTFPLIAAAGFLLAGLGVCRANLGETEAQCIARYGAESDLESPLGYHQVGDKAATFHPRIAGAALTVRVVFLNGRACHENITSADDSRTLSVDQMKTILKTEGGDWHRGRNLYRTALSGDTRGTQDWSRDDGATARFWVGGKGLTENQSGEMELSTKPFADAQAYYDKLDGNE